VKIFGIRHHGPGCARALRAAFDELRPDLVLVEGPPDAEEALPLAARTETEPPVALLVWALDEPRRAVYYPFAGFSPEWQAIRWAAGNGVPARFFDLPQSHQLALDKAEEEAQAKEESGEVPAEEPRDPLHDDPLGVLAEAAGYTDRELWWEQQIEQRRDPAGLFEAILAAMAELRGQARPPEGREALREAFMRQRLRAARKEGFERIAVVCGAWHAPALHLSDRSGPGSAKDDTALLKSLPKLKTAVTWIPWTHSRLSSRSGYGAGVSSPGWYQHLWTAPDRAPVRWVTQAARLLREEDLEASPASAIESVRLAESLAALRGLPMPGLSELNEAVQAVLCHGELSPMALIRERLEIGDVLGKVPDEALTVPLQRDLEAQQRRLRLKPTAEIREIDLDLREENDRARSLLLHRLRLLDIPWGEPRKAHGKAGTFHELWTLAWQPELVVRVIERSLWGHSVEEAATDFAVDLGRKLTDLPPLTELLDRAILAGLPAAVESLLGDLQARAAVTADLRHMMDALPPLARVSRYGDVRGTRATDVLPVVRGLFERIAVGLPGACSSLDDEAAARMADSLARVHESLGVLDLPDLREEWREVLGRLADLEGAHGLVRGYACRLLVDQGVLDAAEVSRRARLALSPAVPARDAAAWIEGLLRGSGLLLLHHDSLWEALDAWLADLAPDTFTEILPLLRRAFSEFQAPERRKMGEKVKHLGRAPAQASRPILADVDPDRAARVLPVLAQILGVKFLGVEP
jgi:hypothetical protein